MFHSGITLQPFIPSGHDISFASILHHVITNIHNRYRYINSFVHTYVHHVITNIHTRYINSFVRTNLRTYVRTSHVIISQLFWDYFTAIHSFGPRHKLRFHSLPRHHKHSQRYINSFLSTPTYVPMYIHTRNKLPLGCALDPQKPGLMSVFHSGITLQPFIPSGHDISFTSILHHIITNIHNRYINSVFHFVHVMSLFLSFSGITLQPFIPSGHDISFAFILRHVITNIHKRYINSFVHTYLP